MSCSLLHAHVVLFVGLLPSHVIMSVSNHVNSQVLLLIFSWMQLWKLCMSILLPLIMHIDDLYLSSYVIVTFVHVRLYSSEHVDGVDLVLGEVHHAIGISGVASEVSVRTEH
jgi:hypothetical protein